MVRGFYQVGAGLLTKSKVLSSVSNNVTNVKTNGYKKQTVVVSTFEQMMLNRVDGENTEIGETQLATVVGDTTTVHSQGNLETTGRNLDFTIMGEGFFAVQTNNGMQYTRMGSFNLDDEGFLTVGGGRVLGTNGQPIAVGTEDIQADDNGTIYAGGQPVGQIAVYSFNDYNALVEAGNGFYTGQGAQLQQNAQVAWQTLEGSNVNIAEEMTTALAAQRELQACAQAIKMYDTIMEQATSSLTRIS